MADHTKHVEAGEDVAEADLLKPDMSVKIRGRDHAAAMKIVRKLHFPFAFIDLFRAMTIVWNGSPSKRQEDAIRRVAEENRQRRQAKRLASVA